MIKVQPEKKPIKRPIQNFIDNCRPTGTVNFQILERDHKMGKMLVKMFSGKLCFRFKL